VVAARRVHLARPHPRTLIGTGKVAELADLARAAGAGVAIFGVALSPSQERNLSGDLGVPVVDRIGLILDIFARRARSHEGKVQVELAQLRHLQTRLVRGWTHLERQAGGIGLRGPGETQLETDRRLIRSRIAQLERRLLRIAGQRTQARRARERGELPTVALVGYTNSGKSTLFNALCGAQTYAADQLFATLDSTLRRIELAQAGPVLVADTVGFVRNLPHTLVAAFRSTLEEVRDADLLIHVRDAASPARDEHARAVDAVLREIGAGEVAQVEVANKIDLIGEAPRAQPGGVGHAPRVWLSARTGAGIELLREVLDERLRPALERHALRLRECPGLLRAQLYARARVLHERFGDDGSWQCEFESTPAVFGALGPLLRSAAALAS
jgi:GTPase